MESAKCPNCASVQVRRASAAWRHALRVLIDSDKRFCRACGEKWHISRLDPEISGPPMSETEVILLASLSGLLVLAGARYIQNPSSWIKTRVRAYYDAKYGVDAKHRLWEDWGWLYPSRDQAEVDYVDHAKK